MGKAVREVFSNMTRNWEPRFPHPVQTGIPQIDARFLVFTARTLPPSARSSSRTRRSARRSSSEEVGFWVDARSAVFADRCRSPERRDGRLVGQMAMGFDYVKRLAM